MHLGMMNRPGSRLHPGLEILPHVVFSQLLPTHQYEGKPPSPPTLLELVAPTVPQLAYAERRLVFARNKLDLLLITIARSATALETWVTKLDHKQVASKAQLDLLKLQVKEGITEVIHLTAWYDEAVPELQQLKRDGHDFIGLLPYPIRRLTPISCPEFDSKCVLRFEECCTRSSPGCADK
jgi:hypothetical protein